MDEMIELERQLAKLQGKADLHGNTPGIEAEMQSICGKLDEIEMGRERIGCGNGIRNWGGHSSRRPRTQTNHPIDVQTHGPTPIFEQPTGASRAIDIGNNDVEPLIDASYRLPDPSTSPFTPTTEQ